MRIRNYLNVLIGCALVSIIAMPGRADVVLTLQGSCPGPMRANITGAEANFSVFLLFARTTGRAHIPVGACRGTVIGLGWMGLREVGSAVADSNGFARIEGIVRDGACGAYLQVMTSPACHISNVVQIK